jgi:hypothetical protein
MDRRERRERVCSDHGVPVGCTDAYVLHATDWHDGRIFPTTWRPRPTARARPARHDEDDQGREARFWSA